MNPVGNLHARWRMDILSYRGPAAAGGVSSALSTLFQERAQPSDRWWYLTDNDLCLSHKSEPAPAPRRLLNVADEILKGHYRFCNEFLWPIMHDLPQFATYRHQDRQYYYKFNLRIGAEIARSANGSGLFVHDYQFALVPATLTGLTMALFWHIPWPRNVDEIFSPPLCDIARGMLQSTVIGFHTQEYARNFLSFVKQRIPEYIVDEENMTLTARRRSGLRVIGVRERTVRIVVCPIGIDTQYWDKLANGPGMLSGNERLQGLLAKPFVLSVDRADYTKGVLERLHAIERFFQKCPERLGRLTFIQVSAPTRTGLEAFDSYWTQCRYLEKTINDRYAANGWQPITWVEKPFRAPDLSRLYRAAEAMVVSPLRDGLNLTAKEFVACQAGGAAPLLLSEGAGAWQELGSFAIPFDPHDAEAGSAAIQSALTMSGGEIAARCAKMKEIVRDGSLLRWWNVMTESITTPATIPQSVHKRSASDDQRNSNAVSKWLNQELNMNAATK